MRLRKNKTNKTHRTTFRSTEEDFQKIQAKAELYTEGNVSEYIAYAALNFVPSKEDFEQPQRKKKRKK